MSLHAMRFVWAADIRPAAKKLVALRIADRCDDEGGNFFMSLASVARDTGLSASQAQRIFRALRNEQFLVVEDREPGRVPRYRLNLQLLAAHAGGGDGAAAEPTGRVGPDSAAAAHKLPMVQSVGAAGGATPMLPAVGSAGAAGGAAPVLPVGGSMDAVGGVAPVLRGGSMDAVGGTAPVLWGDSMGAARSIHTHQLNTHEPGAGAGVQKRVTTAGDAAEAMRGEGLVKASRESKALRALVDRGATNEMFRTAARTARERGSVIRDPIAYALTEVRRLVAEAQTVVRAPAHSPAVLRPTLSEDELQRNGERARQAAQALGIPVKPRRAIAASTASAGSAQ
jgi:hypothetical protein